MASSVSPTVERFARSPRGKWDIGLRPVLGTRFSPRFRRALYPRLRDQGQNPRTFQTGCYPPPWAVARGGPGLMGGELSEKLPSVPRLHCQPR